MIALRPGSGPDGVLIVPPAPLVALPSPVRRDSAAECEPGRCPAGPFGQKDSQLFRTDRGATVRIRPALTICAQPDMLTVTVTMWPRMDAAMPKKQTTAGKNSAPPAALEHRGLLDHPPGFRPFRGTGLFERAGGQQTVDRLVDLLYEGIGDDDQLRPLFPRDLAPSRSMSQLFLAEWLGGPPRYSRQAHPGLGH